MNTTTENIITINDTLEWTDDDNKYEVASYLVVIISICYGSISLLATLGNSLVIWVISTSPRMRSVTNYYIANLALADILIAVFAIPFQFQGALKQRWDLPPIMCSICPFVHALSITVSVLTLTAIAVERHKAILKPFNERLSKCECVTIILLIWLVGIATSYPMGYTMRVRIVDEDRPMCVNAIFADDVMSVYQMSLVLLQYVTPLGIITWAYTGIARALWGATIPGNAQTERDAIVTRNKKRVIEMLMMTTGLFAFCWAPVQTYNFFHGIFQQINEYRYIHYLFFTFDWFALSNTCYNPFIYAIYSESFKREFQTKLRLQTAETKRQQFRGLNRSALSSGKREKTTETFVQEFTME